MGVGGYRESEMHSIPPHTSNTRHAAPKICAATGHAMNSLCQRDFMVRLRKLLSYVHQYMFNKIMSR